MHTYYTYLCTINIIKIRFKFYFENWPKITFYPRISSEFSIKTYFYSFNSMLYKMAAKFYKTYITFKINI